MQPPQPPQVPQRSVSRLVSCQVSMSDSPAPAAPPLAADDAPDTPAAYEAEQDAPRTPPPSPQRGPSSWPKGAPLSRVMEEPEEPESPETPKGPLEPSLLELPAAAIAPAPVAQDPAASPQRESSPPRPRPRPPLTRRLRLSQKQPLRRIRSRMAAPPPDAVADRVLTAFSGGASLASIWRDEADYTVLRIRTSASESLSAAKRALQAALPLATVAMGTNPLDGETEAEIRVPTAKQERHTALARIRARWQLRTVRYAGYGLALAGAGVYLLS